MKKNKSILVSYFLFAIFYSCDSCSNKDFIPGAYVREVKNEFSIGRDTLIIGAVNPNTYTIIHKGSYRQIRDGMLLPVKSISENWPVSYDENKKVLMESKKGKIISFDPSKNILFVGSSLYKKIK